MVHSAVILVLLVLLATARATTLVVDDYISAPLRARVGRWGDWYAYGIGCPWCVSVWAGGILAGLTYAWHNYWPVQILLLMLAGSEVAGLLAVVRDVLEADPDES